MLNVLSIMSEPIGPMDEAASSASHRRNLLRSLSAVLLGLVALAIGILALEPEEWRSTLGAWMRFLSNTWQLILLALFVAALIRLVILERARLTDRDDIAQRGPPSADSGVARPSPNSPEPRLGGVAPFIPADTEEKLRSVFVELGESPEEEHTVRLWLATGTTVLPLIRHYLEKVPTRGRFVVKILLMDPQSQDTKRAGRLWPKEVRESSRLLGELQKTYDDNGRPVKLSVRVYKYPSMIRALLLDEDHLFFGFMTWQRDQGIPQLHHQNNSPLYMHHSDQTSRDFISFVKNWFDHEWEACKQLLPPSQ
jgi:hypothetical protein